MAPQKSQMGIPTEVRIVVEGILEESGRRGLDRNMHEAMVDDLSQHLETIMYFEILTHLPGKHLEAFVKINDQNRTRAELDKFVVRNMPNAEKIFTDAIE